MITLGNQLINPYSVVNMQIAVQQVIREKNLQLTVRLQPTHYYVRFLPASDEELESLELDVNVNELFEYPLDVEITSGGAYYHDPLIPEGEITWQYTTVPINYQFSDIEYEILEELYLSDMANSRIPLFNTPPNSSFTITYEDIELVSLKKTNNFDALDSITYSRGSWNPSGTIKVWDHVIEDYIPIQGVKVVARRFFHTESAFTNEDGYFQTASFKNPVKYKIKWETDEYDIRSGTFGQAVLERKGGKFSSPWNLDIEKDKIQMYYATVHRAAFRYHYQNIDGLRRPGYSSKLKICVYDKNGDSYGMNWANIDPFGILPDIQIWAKHDDAYRPSNGILSTAIHELAHASHRKYMTGIQFSQVSDIIVESWARAVQWRVTQIEYSARGISDYDVPPWNDVEQRHLQNWDSGWSHKYTPLFIDLIDNYNQSLEYGGLPSNRCPCGGAFDGANCLVYTVGSGMTPLIEDDAFWHTPHPSYGCPQTYIPPGRGNCFVMDIPATCLPFIYGQGMYFRPAGNPVRPYDDVNGYTLAYIESTFLKDVYGLHSLKQELKQHKPAGVNNKQIDILMDYYFNL